MPNAAVSPEIGLPVVLRESFKLEIWVRKKMQIAMKIDLGDCERKREKVLFGF
jgi:hypothetical protein